MVWDNELNDRKCTILKSIVDDYIKYAQPVGSRTIARKRMLGLGSATIRNEMADLEELGYITQPYTSAGRIPSDKGYRFYVEHLMQIHSLPHNEIVKIHQALDEHIEEINQLIKNVSLIISDITGYTSVVMSPQIESAVIKSVRLVAVDENRLLVVVVVNGGIVKDKIVRHRANITEDILEKLNQVFNKEMVGKTVDQIDRQIILNIQNKVKVSKEVCDIVIKAIEGCIEKIESIDLYIDGLANMLNHPEFSDMLRAREILELLNEEDVIIPLMKNTNKDRRFEFKIGSENELTEMKDLSIITTVYGSDGKRLGTIGVIGPTRMAYGRVVSAINYIRELLNRELIKILDDDT